MNQELTAEDKAGLKKVSSRLTDYPKQRGNLIPILQMIQEELEYLPPKTLTMVAEYLEINASEVYGVATFYNQFRFHPPGKHPVKVCLGTACHVRAGDIILENFERKLGITEGETSADREFSIERVHGHMAPSKVEGLITRIEIEKEIQEREKQTDESGR
jgi:NADH-quinone oxidoreductase subunit E